MEEKVTIQVGPPFTLHYLRAGRRGGQADLQPRMYGQVQGRREEKAQAKLHANNLHCRYDGRGNDHPDVNGRWQVSSYSVFESILKYIQFRYMY